MVDAASKEQTNIIQQSPKTNWGPIQLPLNPTVPKWALDLHVDWMERYSNSPRIDILTDGTEYGGEWLWEFEKLGKGIYSAEKDGCLQWHYHSMYHRVDDLFDYYEASPIKDGKYHEGITHYKEGFATPKSEGYGGREFPIQMKDGPLVILRGPWYGVAPKGFTEVSNYDHTKAGIWEQKHPEVMKKRGLSPKWPLTGTFGMALRNELLLNLIARFTPHLRAALVTRPYMEDIEPRHANHAPKGHTITTQDLTGE